VPRKSVARLASRSFDLSVDPDVRSGGFSQEGRTVSLAYLVVGVILIVVTVADLLWTALWPDGGAGPLSSRLSTLTWTGLRTVGNDHSRLLGLAGPVILVATLALWIALLWTGWTLVFAGSATSLVDPHTGNPASWIGRAYFVGYSMFTMGNGDFGPSGETWMVATSLTTASGMLFVTMAVTYVLSVLSAVVDKRSFASTTLGFGDPGERIVLNAWNGEDLHALDLPLDTFTSGVSRLAEQHKAYPILHYYHSEDEAESSAMAVAVFDEALTLLRFGVDDDARPSEPLVTAARSNTKTYLETLDFLAIEPADEAPPPPDLGRLRATGVPTVSDESFDDALDDLRDRRRKLLGAVVADAWYWPPIDHD